MTAQLTLPCPGGDLDDVEYAADRLARLAAQLPDAAVLVDRGIAEARLGWEGGAGLAFQETAGLIGRRMADLAEVGDDVARAVGRYRDELGEARDEVERSRSTLVRAVQDHAEACRRQVDHALATITSLLPAPAAHLLGALTQELRSWTGIDPGAVGVQVVRRPGAPPSWVSCLDFVQHRAGDALSGVLRRVESLLHGVLEVAVDGLRSAVGRVRRVVEDVEHVLARALQVAWDLATAACERALHVARSTGEVVVAAGRRLLGVGPGDRRRNDTPVVDSDTDHLSFSVNVHAGVGGKVGLEVDVSVNEHADGRYTVTVDESLQGGVGAGFAKVGSIDAVEGLGVAGTYNFATREEAEQFRRRLEAALAAYAVDRVRGQALLSALLTLYADHTAALEVSRSSGVTVSLGSPVGVDGHANLQVELGAGARTSVDLTTGVRTHTVEVHASAEASIDAKALTALGTGVEALLRGLGGPTHVGGVAEGTISASVAVGPDGHVRTLGVHVQATWAGQADQQEVGQHLRGERHDVVLTVDLSSREAQVAAERLLSALASGDLARAAASLEALRPYADLDHTQGTVEISRVGADTPLGGGEASNTHYHRTP